MSILEIIKFIVLCILKGIIPVLSTILTGIFIFIAFNYIVLLFGVDVMQIIVLLICFLLICFLVGFVKINKDDI